MFDLDHEPPHSTSSTSPAISPSGMPGATVEQALQSSTRCAARWRDRIVASIGESDPEHRWLAAVPDVGPSCEMLLADQLFHDLSATERDGLLEWIRGSQDASGAWLSVDGSPDLSLTVLGWWARLSGGDDVRDPTMVQAQRVVHALGGAQRANFEVRLWLALCGAVPWDYLPAIPGELFLLPQAAWLSPSRIAPWARGVLTPYYIIARCGGHLNLPDPSALLLRRDSDKKALVSPRLTRPGLAGDLLQAFDRTVKLSRKLPRGPLPRWAVERATHTLGQTRQHHGGWFSTRPTLLSLVALRVQGAPADDPRIASGLEHLRASRGWARIPHGRQHGERALAQGMGGTRLAAAARLLQAAPDTDGLTALLRMELSTPGPWQERANALAGGWSHEPNAEHHLDVQATCAMLDLLGTVPETSVLRTPAWAARRRATDVLLAMQEGSGGFARFERGEAEVFMRRLPWTDADLLAMGEADDTEHVQLSAGALAQLGRTGFRLDDDRVARGVDWLETVSNGHKAASAHSVQTLCTLALAAVATCPVGHPVRSGVEQDLRARQQEDGSFGGLVDTATALTAILELAGPCVQSRRAARFLAEASLRHGDDLDQADRPSCRGFGLSPALHDPSAAPREVSLALRAYVRHTTGSDSRA